MRGFARSFSHYTIGALLSATLLAVTPAFAQKPGDSQSASAEISSDVILKAMHEELERSKEKLKMDNVPAPYYIEYRLADLVEYDAEADFGALTQKQDVHARSIHVVVRVGDYKQDSYYRQGLGMTELAPLDNDLIALRRQLWLATDQAYKMASEALAAKKAVMSEYNGPQPYDDFAHATPIQSVDPLAKLDYDTKPWPALLEKATALFRTDPRIDSLTARASFRAVNQ